MATTKDRLDKVEKNLRKVDREVKAIFKIIDENKAMEIEKEKARAAREAVEEYAQKDKDKLEKRRHRTIWYFIVPIILLIISNILAWLFDFGFIWNY